MIDMANIVKLHVVHMRMRKEARIDRGDVQWRLQAAWARTFAF